MLSEEHMEIMSLKNRLGIMRELVLFLWQEKIYWLIPLMILLFLFALVITVSVTTGLGPFVYPLI
jgi:hypothetical protein